MTGEQINSAINAGASPQRLEVCFHSGRMTELSEQTGIRIDLLWALVKRWPIAFSKEDDGNEPGS